MDWTEAGARGTKSASAAASTTDDNLTREDAAAGPAEAAPEREAATGCGPKLAEGPKPETRRTAR
eukprot:5615575-Lingulodinium_polyedra.AAC.1